MGRGRREAGGEAGGEAGRERKKEEEETEIDYLIFCRLVKSITTRVRNKYKKKRGIIIFKWV